MGEREDKIRGVAKKWWLRGVSCSEASLTTHNRCAGIEAPLEEQASHLLSGGMMYQGNACGLLSGAVLSAGLQAARRFDDDATEALTEFEGCDPTPSCTNCAVETLKRIASDDQLARSGPTYVAGLAGGVGLLGRSCAALTVGILVLTFRHYAARGSHRRDSRFLGSLHELGLARFRRRPARLLEEFELEFGGDLCSEIVGRLFTSPDDHASSTSGNTRSVRFIARVG